MEATVLTWTRIARPPSGHEPGRVVVLVDAEGARRYALWTRTADPRVGERVRVEETTGTLRAG